MPPLKSMVQKVPSMPKSHKWKCKCFGSHLKTTAYFQVVVNLSPTQASATSSKARMITSQTSTVQMSSPRPVYISTYRRNAPAITYDSFQFTWMTCDVDQTGVVCLIQADTAETILIGEDWQSHIKVAKPSGAYLSKGFMKYAFKVSVSSHRSRLNAKFYEGLLKFQGVCNFPVQTSIRIYRGSQQTRPFGWTLPSGPGSIFSQYILYTYDNIWCQKLPQYDVTPFFSHIQPFIVEYHRNQMEFHWCLHWVCH